MNNINLLSIESSTYEDMYDKLAEYSKAKGEKEEFIMRRIMSNFFESEEYQEFLEEQNKKAV